MASRTGDRLHLVQKFLGVLRTCVTYLLQIVLDSRLQPNAKGPASSCGSGLPQVPRGPETLRRAAWDAHLPEVMATPLHLSSGRCTTGANEWLAVESLRVTYISGWGPQNMTLQLEP